MNHQSGTFLGHRDFPLFRQSWSPDSDSKAVIAITHGIGEHSGRYMNIVDQLVPHGIAVHSYDLRGHGQSSGKRGHINRWEEYREDLRIFLSFIKNREKGLPIFLLGHSLGAMTAIDYLAHHREETMNGAIISAVPIEPVGAAKPLLVLLSRMLTKVLPGLTVTLGLDTTAVSRDPAVIKSIGEDKLCHNNVSVRWGTESLDKVVWIQKHASEMTLPVFIIHGEADRISAPGGSRKLYETIGSSDKELHIYPGGYHELHNDIIHEQVIGDIELWVKNHFQNRDH
jgi:alpha-beta hydrolase superfamily lysophospholipase